MKCNTMHAAGSTVAAVVLWFMATSAAVAWAAVVSSGPIQMR